jgi:hypothetical protein
MWREAAFWPRMDMNGTKGETLNVWDWPFGRAAFFGGTTTPTNSREWRG